MDHLDVDAARRLIAGELAPAEAARWMTHLAVCERCRVLVEQERNWSGLMRLGDPAAAALGEPAPLPEVVVRIPKAAPPSSAGEAAVWVVIACLGAAGVVWQWARRPAVEPPPPPLTQQEHRAVALQTELAVLIDDPWVESDLDTILALDRLLQTKQ